ncbi:MAG: TVP38/TMEM64 family protein [Planctomycetes bacterium]|nr:TVP38/TMEM64 family protein [Planctomycetota bacterium]
MEQSETPTITPTTLPKAGAPEAALKAKAHRKEVIKQLGPTAVLGAIWAIAPAVLGGLLLWNLDPISTWLRSMEPWGWLIYVAVFIVSAGIGFLPTYGQSLLGGWVFGFALGFPGAMLGFVGGSVIGYAIAQGVSKHKVEEVLDANPKAHAIREALIGHGFWRTLWVVTLIRLPPNSPFALTNLVLASSGVRFLPYLIGTAIGLAPRTGIVAFAAALGSKRAKNIQEFILNQEWWVTALGVTITVLALGILVFIAERALKAVSKGAPAK